MHLLMKDTDSLKLIADSYKDADVLADRSSVFLADKRKAGITP
jgi:hypothetical protein